MTPPADQPPPHIGRQSFGRLIAARRRHLGLSQTDLADALCAVTGRPTITRHEVSRYERGLRLPRSPILAAIATCLDLPLPTLRQTAAHQRAQQTRDGSEICRPGA
jgi:transcriptional regulator with XRE-family HTH domain